MHELMTLPVHCPYCGELLQLIIDPSESEQDLIEDCQVCCQPMNLHFTINNEGDTDISVWRDDE